MRKEDRMKTREQIERTKSELARARPRSRRRVELESRLRDLMTRQLRAETKRKAA